jgi:hypothetical protein
MLRSVGVGAPIWSPFYPAELEIELSATTPVPYSTLWIRNVLISLDLGYDS